MLVNTFIYGYVKIYRTSNFAYGAWIGVSKMDEGADRHSEKGRTFKFFFPLGWETDTFAVLIV